MSSANSTVRRLEPLVTAVAPQPVATEAAAPPARKVRRTPEKLCRALTLIGLGFLVPIIRMICGEEPRMQLAALWRTLGVPVIGIVLFVMLWSFLAARIHTSLGQVPGPSAVLEQATSLWADHKAERARAAAV